jgi:hypothetical protein
MTTNTTTRTGPPTPPKYYAKSYHRGEEHLNDEVLIAMLTAPGIPEDGGLGQGRPFGRPDKKNNADENFYLLLLGVVWGGGAVRCPPMRGL